MANISIHYTAREVAPKINAEVSQLPSCDVLRITETEHDSVVFFFDGRDDVINFVDKINQALTAYLQANERGGE